MKKLLAALTMGIVAGLSFVLPALAGPAFTETNTLKDVTEVDFAPLCEGGTVYNLSITYNAVEHITVKDSTIHVTFTQTGKFTATDPVTGEVITGSFTFWDGFNATLLNPDDPESDIVPGTPAQGTFTFSIRGRGDMGTRIQASNVGHFNHVPSGSVNEFFHGHCNVT